MIAAILHSSLIVSASSCLKMLSVRIVMLVCSFSPLSRSLAAGKVTIVSELKTSDEEGVRNVLSALT